MPTEETELETIIKFLCGETMLDGMWYGEQRSGKPTFWWRKPLREAYSVAKDRIRAEVLDEVEIEKLTILAALADMYGQYCGGPFGHDFMSAGEGAIEILEKYNLGKELEGIDYAALDKLEEHIAQLSNKEH